MPLSDEVFRDMPDMSDSALLALLGLVRLSFRFEPEQCTWVCPDRTFSRADIQAQVGLSEQGTRNGLGELADTGHVSIDSSGRGYEYALKLGVPSSRYTYVPTALLEEAPDRLSGTELRLVLAVLRATWGWTDRSDANNDSPRHKRWARLSVPVLSELTGRSETAVKGAAQDLQGVWIQRCRPTTGAYCYRFRTEALSADDALTDASCGSQSSASVLLQKKTDAFFSVPIPNDLTPDRPKSVPPHRGKKESTFQRPTQHLARTKNTETRGSQSTGAVRGQQKPSRPPSRTHSSGTIPEAGPDPQRRFSMSGTDQKIPVSGFSERKQQLGQILANVGVWPRRIPTLLGRYSADRIEVNFQLFRKRASQIQSPGAWLATAIVKGFALPSSSHTSAVSVGDPQQCSKRPNPPNEGHASPLPDPGTMVSQERKESLLQSEKAAPEDFDRAPADERGRPQFFYKLDPGPSRAAPLLSR